jgi:hypothetical protein
MIDRALDAGIPCAWVLGDEVYGSHHKLRAALERREQASVLTVRCNEQFWAVRQKKTGWYTAAELADACPASAWQCHSAGAGTKGERLYDWARRAKGSVRRSRMEWQDEGRVPLARRGPPQAQTHWQHWLLIRRHRQDPDDVAYYVVFGPADTSLATLARVAGLRWTVEECFEVAKQEVGLDDYEVRSWHGWYRHITLAMLALAFLVAMRVKLNAAPPQTGNGAPSQPMVDLSVGEIRHLISRLLLVAGLALDAIFPGLFGGAWTKLSPNCVTGNDTASVPPRNKKLNCRARIHATCWGKRHCPPEDCGGPWGYAELLDALADPAHPEYADRRAWVDEDFDPEAFDVADADMDVALRFGRK